MLNLNRLRIWTAYEVSEKDRKSNSVGISEPPRVTQSHAERLGGKGKLGRAKALSRAGYSDSFR